MHKWIGTYNLYVIILEILQMVKQEQVMEGIKKLKRKEKSIYKPSDLWTSKMIYLS